MIAVITGIILFLLGLFEPWSAPLAGLSLALFTFYYLTYPLPTGDKIWSELRLWLVVLFGSSLGSFLLWVACNYVKRPVCLPNHLKAQIFVNYAFPLIAVIPLWLIYRLPVVVKELFDRLTDTIKEMLYKMKS
jgi:hypothetical protein